MTTMALIVSGARSRRTSSAALRITAYNGVPPPATSPLIRVVISSRRGPSGSTGSCSEYTVAAPGNAHRPTSSLSDNPARPLTAAFWASSSLVLPAPAECPIDPDMSRTSNTRAGFRSSVHVARGPRRAPAGWAGTGW